MGRGAVVAPPRRVRAGECLGDRDGLGESTFLYLSLAVESG